ncbi:hypothetical protein [Streptomyces sp. NBC_00102]|uniref:hypothetical protein n=1 Tax=Streptomyces sp. NBC_00102 TaxID=2975652 RepID=UPI002251ABE3|nr:hypothetical protein [Streptomyces sp. NBC_00102]MCX5402108.1 hypothetical protein [Streptomyces sp. NBC_00102]
MTTGSKTTTVFLTIILGLLMTILGVTQQWPAWAWPALVTFLVLIPAVAFEAARRRRGHVPVRFEEQLTAAPIERQEQQVRHVSLPSLWADYDFLISATVRWHLLDTSDRDPVLNPAGLAVEAVLARARAVTEQREPMRASFVQHELNGCLGHMLPDGSGHLRAMAENVTLTLHQHDQERLDSLAGVRKDKAVWEHQRTYEQSKRKYLGEDVLKDTGSAVVWWLAKNDDQVEKTVADLGLLAQLTSAANDTAVPELLRDLFPQPREEHDVLDEQVLRVEAPTVADHFAEGLDAMDFPQGDVRRSMLAKQLADIMRTQEQHEAADDLVHRFDPPATFTPNRTASPGQTDAETDTDRF